MGVVCLSGLLWSALQSTILKTTCVSTEELRKLSWSRFSEWLYLSFLIWKAQGPDGEGIYRSTSFSFVLLAGICISNDLYPKRVVREFTSTENFRHIKTLEEVRTHFGVKIKTL